MFWINKNLALLYLAALYISTSICKLLNANFLSGLFAVVLFFAVWKFFIFYRRQASFSVTRGVVYLRGLFLFRITPDPVILHVRFEDESECHNWRNVKLFISILSDVFTLFARRCIRDLN